MAACVICHAMREIRADVVDTELVDQEFAELVGARQQCGKLLAEFLVAELGKEAGVLVTDHGDAGRGGITTVSASW